MMVKSVLEMTSGMVAKCAEFLFQATQKLQNKSFSDPNLFFWQLYMDGSESLSWLGFG